MAFSPNKPSFVFRLAREKYAHELSGKGAALHGNRWNSKGTEIIYTTSSRALALAEILVHLPPKVIPSDFKMLKIRLPAVYDLETIKELPKDWNAWPHNKQTCIIGDLFIQKNENLVLRVPSAVVQEEYNYLLNPFHKKFDAISIENATPFSFDSRYFFMA